MEPGSSVGADFEGSKSWKYEDSMNTDFNYEIKEFTDFFK